MSKELYTTTREASLESAARAMKDHDVGMLPVVSPEGRVVGTITDRDIAVRAVAKGLDPSRTVVESTMTDGCEFCFDDDTVADVTRRMSEQQLHRIVVMSRERRAPVGVVSLSDLAVLPATRTLLGDVLQKITEGAPLASYK
jgi:CBS domain-containing protein